MVSQIRCIPVHSFHGNSFVRSAVIRSTASRLSGAGCNFAPAQRSIVLVR